MPTSPKQPLPDSKARTRFRQELDCNFSVIAPAGVGKTRAIVERIAHLAAEDARKPDAALLPNLIVVTYTRKAADELRERAYSALINQEKQLPEESLARLNQAFFGTIHSLCLKLLHTYGFTLGLSSKLEPIEDLLPLWEAFLNRSDTLSSSLPAAAREALLRHLDLAKIAEIAHTLRTDTLLAKALPPFPNTDFKPVLSYTGTSKTTQKGVAEGQALLKRWQANLENGATFLPLPNFRKGGKNFQKLWEATFRPLRDWLGDASLYLAAEVAQKFSDFRRSKGYVTYDDMVTLAAQLLRDRSIGAHIRAQRHCVILDEAQDTDRQQFEILLELARPEEVRGNSIENDPPAPGRGRFCMVGDPQQSIYGDRADLPTYLEIHQRLVTSAAAEALHFGVTFRCDHEIVACINALFPNILTPKDSTKSQVTFAPLQARPDAGTGQIVRYPLKTPEETINPRKTREAAEAFAIALAKWINTLTLQDLRADDWAQVAILCPRNDWLAVLAIAFETHTEQPCQIHSHKRTHGDDPAHAWFTALLTVTVQPENALEVAGVLREIFGISDHDIAVWVKQQHPSLDHTTHPLQILHPIQGKGPVAETLNQLATSRAKALQLPLRDAAHHLIQATHLYERLSALPPYPSGQLAARLDALLVQTTYAEHKGQTLIEWTQQLRENFATRAEPTPPLPGHLQLYSCYKAKGLEWQTVILPYLHRPITFAPNTYPKLLQPRSGPQPAVAIDPQHERPDHKNHIAQERRQELERLLYVALTRARHTTVLIDDSTFFPQHGASFANLLQILPDQHNHPYWRSLPEKLQPSKTSSTPARAAAEPLPPIPLIPKVTKNCIKTALENATHFVQRILPSTLTQAPLKPTEPYQLHALEISEGGTDPDHNDRGTAYGNWWHAVMETAPWDQGQSTWKHHFLQTHSEALGTLAVPNPKRAATEIQQFLESELAQRLSPKTTTIYTEVPILWAKGPQAAYDGSIDLLAYDTHREVWLVVDWKTNRLDDPKTLLNIYEPQLRAYVEALGNILKQPVEGLLYSTPTAVTIPLE